MWSPGQDSVKIDLSHLISAPISKTAFGDLSECGHKSSVLVIATEPREQQSSIVYVIQISEDKSNQGKMIWKNIA